MPVSCSRSASAKVVRFLLVTLTLVAISVVSPAAGNTETPAEAVAGTAAGGVYVAAGLDGYDESRLASLVARAQTRGIRLLIVVPRDPQPDPEAFALRVRQAGDVEAVLLFAEGGDGSDNGGGDGGGVAWASVVDAYDDGVVRALAAARNQATPEAAVEVFLDQLLTEPDRPVPPVITRIIRWTIALLVILGLATVAEQLLRRRRRQEYLAAQGD